jgi:hypothetical protein
VGGCDATKGRIRFNPAGPDYYDANLFKSSYGFNFGAELWTAGNYTSGVFRGRRFAGSGDSGAVCEGPGWTSNTEYVLEYDLSTTWFFKVQSIDGVNLFAGCGFSSASAPVYDEGGVQEFGGAYRADKFYFADPYVLGAATAPPDGGGGDGGGSFFDLGPLIDAIMDVFNAVFALPGRILDGLLALLWDPTVPGEVTAWLSSRTGIPPLSWLLEIHVFMQGIVPTVQPGEGGCVPLPGGRAACPATMIGSIPGVTGFIQVGVNVFVIVTYLFLARSTWQTLRA